MPATARPFSIPKRSHSEPYDHRLAERRAACSAATERSPSTRSLSAHNPASIQLPQLGSLNHISLCRGIPFMGSRPSASGRECDGVTRFPSGLLGKALQLFKEVVPNISRLAVLGENAPETGLRAAAGKLNLEVLG